MKEQARMFVPDKPFKASQMFPSKAWWWQNLRVGTQPYTQTFDAWKKLAVDKRSSLFRFFNKHEKKG